MCWIKLEKNITTADGEEQRLTVSSKCFHLLRDLHCRQASSPLDSINPP